MKEVSAVPPSLGDDAVKKQKVSLTFDKERIILDVRWGESILHEGDLRIIPPLQATTRPKHRKVSLWKKRENLPFMMQMSVLPPPFCLLLGLLIGIDKKEVPRVTGKPVALFSYLKESFKRASKFFSGRCGIWSRRTLREFSSSCLYTDARLT